MPCYAIDGIAPVVDPTAFVHPAAVLIGDVIVGPGCYVGPCACLRGDMGRIELHRGANVDDRPRFAALLDAVAGVAAELPLLWPLHPRARARGRKPETSGTSGTGGYFILLTRDK